MYRTEIFSKMVSLNELEKNFCDREKFEELCKQCRNYGKVWSCPPYNFSVVDYLKEYKYVYIVGVKIIFSEETLKSTNTSEKINEYTTKTLEEMKNKILTSMVAMEKIYPDTKALSAGGCKLCEKCSKELGSPCCHPELLRYSLESLGFDVGKISSEILNFDLKWATATRLPDYFSLITGLLVKNEIEGIHFSLKV